MPQTIVIANTLGTDKYNSYLKTFHSPLKPLRVETEAGLRVGSQSGLHSEFQATQSYKVRPCPKTKHTMSQNKTYNEDDKKENRLMQFLGNA